MPDAKLGFRCWSGCSSARSWWPYSSWPTSFFVAAEFALVSVRETRLDQLIALGHPGARTALQLKRNIDDFLPAVQFGVTLAALALGWIGEPAVAEMILHGASRLLRVLPPHATVYANAIAVVVAFGVITYFEVLLGELVPKSLALQRTERIALAVAGPMDVFIRMTRPAVRLMNSSATAVLRLFNAPLSGEGPVHSPEELKLIATVDSTDGASAGVSGADHPSGNRAVACHGEGDYDSAGEDLLASGEPAGRAGEARGSSRNSIRGFRCMRRRLRLGTRAGMRIRTRLSGSCTRRTSRG